MAHRYFSPEEANGLLPGLREAVEGMLARKHEVTIKHLASHALAAAIQLGDGDLATSQHFYRLVNETRFILEEIRQEVEVIDSLGCSVDVRGGQLDFPAWINGEEGRLCWQPGDGMVAFWHRPERSIVHGDPWLSPPQGQSGTPATTIFADTRVLPSKRTQGANPAERLWKGTFRKGTGGVWNVSAAAADQGRHMGKTGGLSILVGLEDLWFRTKIADTAARLGDHAYFANTGKEFWDRAHKVRPSLIILDLGAPTLDPLVLIQALKLDPALYRIPILGYVAHVNTEVRRRALAAGCDEVAARSAFSRRLPAFLERYRTRPGAGAEVLTDADREQRR